MPVCKSLTEQKFLLEDLSETYFKTEILQRTIHFEEVTIIWHTNPQRGIRSLRHVFDSNPIFLCCDERTMVGFT